MNFKDTFNNYSCGYGDDYDNHDDNYDDDDYDDNYDDDDYYNFDDFDDRKESSHDFLNHDDLKESSHNIKNYNNDDIVYSLDDHLYDSQRELERKRELERHNELKNQYRRYRRRNGQFSDSDSDDERLSLDYDFDVESNHDDEFEYEYDSGDNLFNAIIIHDDNWLLSERTVKHENTTKDNEHIKYELCLSGDVWCIDFIFVNHDKLFSYDIIQYYDHNPIAIKLIQFKIDAVTANEIFKALANSLNATNFCKKNNKQKLLELWALFTELRHKKIPTDLCHVVAEYL